MTSDAPDPGPSQARIDRVAWVVGRHTIDICVLAARAHKHLIGPEEFEEAVRSRSARTVLVLLACLHEDGPP